MKATFALMMNNEIHNYMRRLAYQINEEYDVGFFGSQLPPHISLKQPFFVTDIYEVEKYFDELANKIKPIEIEIQQIYIYPPEDSSGIFLDIKETPTLRYLHNLINKELAEKFTNTNAMFDGDEYHFHATIALGNSSQMSAYKNFHDKVSFPDNLKFTANEIVMFYYDDDNYKVGSFMTYKINKLLGD